MHKRLAGVFLTILISLALLPWVGVPLAVAQGAPANDNFANAQALTIPSSVNGSTSGATLEAGELDTISTCIPSRPSVWFKVTPTVAGTFVALVSGFDTVLALYTGTSIGSLTQIACNDNFESSASRIVATVSAGTTYYLRLAGFNGASGNYRVTVSMPGVGTMGGRGFRIYRSSAAITEMEWEGGTAQSSYVFGRFTASGGTIFPQQGPGFSFLAENASDVTPFSGPVCYQLFPLGVSGALARSDLLCWLANTRSATGAPQNFRIRLNESSVASLSWQFPAGGGQDGYILLPIPPNIPILLPSTATSYQHNTAGPTCYVLYALRNSAVMGLTDVMCGDPGQSQFPPADAMPSQE